MSKGIWLVAGCDKNNTHPAAKILKAKSEEEAVELFEEEKEGLYYRFAIPLGERDLKYLNIDIKNAIDEIKKEG